MSKANIQLPNGDWTDVVVVLDPVTGLPSTSMMGAGSHVYGYTGGNLTTDTWTLNGVVRVKTYTYTAGVLTAESDWT